MRVLLMLLLGGGLAAAQVSTSPILSKQMKDGRRIIDEAIDALGGDSFLGMTTKVESGRFYSFFHAQLSGLTVASVYTKYLIAPDPPKIDEVYLRERQAFGKDEKWSVVFNEKGGFEVTFRGVRPLPEEQFKSWRERRRKDIFYILLRRLNEEGMIFERRTRDVIDNMPLEVVDITDSNNEVVTVYFHYTTKLPMRQQFDRRDKLRIRHVETTIFGKYKDVGGGVMLPKVVQRERDGKKVFSMFAEKIEINVPLSEDQISFPGDLKMIGAGK